MLVLLSYTPTAIVGSSYEQRIKDSYPVDDRADVPNRVKQEIYKLNGLQEGFRLIGENFEKFVDTNIAKLMPAEDNADVDAIELLDALNQKIENEIIRKTAPLAVDEIKIAINNKEDLAIDQPQEFAKKHPILNYALDYSDSFTGQIFRDLKGPSGEIIKSVMNISHNTSCWGNDHKTFLMEAITNKNESVILFLLAGGVDVNARNDSRDTALHLAAKMNEGKVAQLLIDNKADVNAKDMFDSTPLHTASSNNSYAVTQILIDNGADVNARNCSGFTPLQNAAGGDSYNIAQILINNGADVNARTNDGNTPLHDAVYWNKNEIAQLLIQHGADVNARTNDGNTPLHIAIVWSHNKITQMLIQHGADVNARNNKGNTPLHNAAALNNNEIAQRLIQHGADINARNNDGNTPSDVASKPEMQNLLRARQQELASSIATSI